MGQGDAILIQKNTTQILIDGGPNNKVLDCLGKHMPFWDREIELVVLTHPEEDHYGGLIDVIKYYKIGRFATNGRDSGNLSYQVLKNEVGSRGLQGLTLSDDMDLRLGMIYLDILHPAGELQMPNDKLQIKKTNDTGIVILLKYARFKALFTADVEQEISNQLSESSKIQNINYLKVNHHGSKNGLSEKLLEVLKPKVAVISLGKNSYGHPHKEVLDMLNKYNVKILRTDQMGDVVVKTDGNKFW